MIDQYVKILAERFIDGAGFAERAGGVPRSDATCWAILALRCVNSAEELRRSAETCLLSLQSPDGRVSIIQQQPEAYWPTSLAILAWHGAPQLEEPQARAVRFLLEDSQVRTIETPRAILGYDTMLKGWSWTTDTFSWVEPTSLAVIAMRTTGHRDHERPRHAVNFLMDRQLPDGGWNVGSSIVFGHALRPMPENTGMALQALCGLVPRKDIEKSISYLVSCIDHLRTPFTLGWSLLGLAAWAEPAPQRDEMVTNLLQSHERYLSYGTTALSVLLVAHCCVRGLIDFLGGE